MRAGDEAFERTFGTSKLALISFSLHCLHDHKSYIKTVVKIEVPHVRISIIYVIVSLLCRAD